MIRYNTLRVGDRVEDKTAALNGWEDRFGHVVEVDAGNVLVEYESGRRRAKLHINLRKLPVE